MSNKENKLLHDNIIEANAVNTDSPFNITAEDVRIATIRFMTEGSRTRVGNPKGIAGISILRNKYHRIRSEALDIVAASKR